MATWDASQDVTVLSGTSVSVAPSLWLPRSQWLEGNFRYGVPKRCGVLDVPSHLGLSRHGLQEPGFGFVGHELDHPSQLAQIIWPGSKPEKRNDVGGCLL